MELYYFIDFDDVLGVNPKGMTFSVVYGNRSDFDNVVLVASFEDEQDAFDYVEWKNDLFEENNIDDLVDKFSADVLDEIPAEEDEEWVS